MPGSKSQNQQMKLFLVLVIGIVFGFSVSQLLRGSICSFDIKFSIRVVDLRKFVNYKDELELKLGTDAIVVSSDSENQSHIQENANDSFSGQLYKEVRVLCWILTGPKYHQTRAIHVKNTWGKRCNKLLFMSSTNDTDLGTIMLPAKEGRGNIWHKTRESAKYIYDHYLNEADWFLKADDDTYVLPENLRSFLYEFSSESPIYFGCKFKPHVRQGYMSGGAGYVLSREALRRFAEHAYNNSRICRQHIGGSEDKEMGFCLQNVGVIAGDSRDKLKRGRFFPSAPINHVKPMDKNHWYWRYIYYQTEDGLNCCSNYAISFHNIQPRYFYILDYLIYKLKIFGLSSNNEVLPEKRNMEKWLSKWRNEISDNPL